MGTSASSTGPSSSTPLVPTWVDDQINPAPTESPSETEDDTDDDSDDQGQSENENEHNLPPIEVPQEKRRFLVPRVNLTKFARSGSRSSLERGLSSYVRNGSGGPRTAARRMAVPQRTAGRILSFAQAVGADGTAQALKEIGLDHYAGRPIAEVLPLIIDALCDGNGGSIDDGIARDALTEAVFELLGDDVGNQIDLSAEQLRELFTSFVAHSIKDRVLNDVGTNGVKLPDEISDIQQMERTLLDVIRGCVRDAIGTGLSFTGRLSALELTRKTDEIYQAAYALISQLGEEE